MSDDRLIVALDVPNILHGQEMVRRIGDAACFYKIGLGMLTGGGLALANELKHEMGKRVFDNIGKSAWAAWLAHQTMLINENRLSPMNPEHRAFLEREMEKFLFEGSAQKPEGYLPENADA